MTVQRTMIMLAGAGDDETSIETAKASLHASLVANVKHRTGPVTWRIYDDARTAAEELTVALSYPEPERSQLIAFCSQPEVVLVAAMVDYELDD